MVTILPRGLFWIASLLLVLLLTAGCDGGSAATPDETDRPPPSDQEPDPDPSPDPDPDPDPGDDPPQPDTYSLGGQLNGLLDGNQLVVRNQEQDELVLLANGAFTFPTPLEDADEFSVAVVQQPDAPVQQCSVAMGEGVISGADFLDVVIDCTFTVSGRVVKGPFKSLDVQARRYEPSINGWGDAFAVRVDGDRYAFEARIGEAFKLDATGTFLDELSGELVRLAQPLSSVFMANPEPQNVNLFTDLAAALLAGQGPLGESPEKLIGETEKNLIAALGLAPETRLGPLFPDEFDEKAPLDDPNLSLLLLSGSVMNLPRSGDQMPGDYYGLLQGLRSGVPVKQGLSVLAGMDAADIYQQIRDSQAFGELPTLDHLANVTWLCDPDCLWFEFAEPSISVADVVAYEARGEALITVRRTGLSFLLGEERVRLSTAEGSALAGYDFLETDIELQFEAGQRSLTLAVPLIVDAVQDPIKTFTVRLSDTSMALARAQAQVSILDEIPDTALALAEASLVDVSACFLFSGEPKTPLPGDCTDVLSPVVNIPLDDPYALGLAFGLHATCGEDEACSLPGPEWLMELTLLAEAQGELKDSIRLADYLYPADSVTNVRLSKSPERGVLASLNQLAIYGFLSDAWQQGWTVRLKASLPSSDTDDLVAESPLPAYFPLPDHIAFGPERLQLNPDDLVINTAADSAGQCEAGSILVSGTYTKPFFFMEQEVELSVDGEVCVTVDSASTDPALVVTAGTIVLDGKVIPVPDFHRVLYSANLYPLFQEGENEWKRPVQSLPYLQVPTRPDGEQGQVLIKMILASEHLPFGYWISGADLGPNGFELLYAGTEMIVDPHLHPSDPRFGQVPSNTVPFYHGEPGTLLLSDAGITASTQFASGSGRSGWPSGDLDWQSFSVEVTNGRLVSGDLDLAFRLEQNTSCREAACLPGQSAEHQVSGNAQIGADGTFIGAVVADSSDGVRWGARADGDAWQRPNDLQPGDDATLVLPGFIVPADGLAAQRLRAHRAQQPTEVVAHDPGSSAFRRGNYFAPGINLGPEYYANSLGQPEVGQGFDYGARPLTVNLGSDELSLVGHTATKLVLSNAGVTGVFNADLSAITEPPLVYGYPMAFDRFAVRLENNRMDKRNWVDGGIDLPGDADFPVAFESLDINCSGQLGTARIASGQCEGGCELGAWQAQTRLFELQFTNSQGLPSAQCSVADQYLTLMQEADFLALDKALLLDVTWSALGEVMRSTTQHQDQYRFDANEDHPGFPMTATAGELGEPWNENGGRYGTALLSGQVALPFWQALDSDVRLANRVNFAAIEAEPTVVAPRQSLYGDSPAMPPALYQQPNRSLVLDLANEPDFDLSARYEWGNTGFGFSLPVYYDLTDPGRSPQFLGRRWEQDLFVLEANAGIDYITPERTKLSFGASADFERLQELRFQVDLNNTASLKKVDELLMQAGLIQEPLIAPTLGGLSQQMERITNFSQQGVDTVLEKALLIGLEQAGAAAAPLMPTNEDPIVVLANTMAQVRTLPDQLLARIDTELLAPVYAELDTRELQLRGYLLELVTDLEDFSNQVEGAKSPEQLEAAIDQVINYGRGLKAEISAISNQIRQPLTDARTQLDRLPTLINEVQIALTEVDLLAEQVSGFAQAQCQVSGSELGAEVNGFLNSAWQHLENLRSVLDLLEGGELLGLLADSIVEDPATRNAMDDARRTLSRNAESLTQKLEEAESALRTRLCESDIQQVIAQVQDFVHQTRQGVVAIAGFVADVESTLDQIENSLTTVETIINIPMEFIIGQLNSVKEQISLGDQTELFFSVSAIDREIARATNDSITVLVSRQEGDIDLFDFSFNLVRDGLSTLRNNLAETLTEQMDGRLPLATFSADQLRRYIVSKIMDSGPVKDVREALNEQLAELGRQLNDNLMMLADQANEAIRKALQQVENQVNEVLEQAQAAVRDVPLKSASLDGYGVIAGHELERAHIQAEWTMAPASEGEPGNTFGASLTAVSWSANDKDMACDVPDAASTLDVTIAAMNLPARIGTSDITLKKVYLGFTLNNSDNPAFALQPTGVFGGLAVVGDIGFTEFVIYDPAFAAGLGSQEVYLGAAAGAVFSDIQAEVAFLVGRTCNQEVLLELDPDVAKFIPIPDSGFSGAYVRGSASIPVWTNGCPLTIGVSADMGAWVLAGPPVTVGGLVGGGAYGKVLCIGSLRGQVRALGSVTADDEISFVGEGFGVAGAGLCEPATWTSVPRSREDSWCGTGDARFQAGYQNGWSIMDLTTSAVH